MDRSSQIYPEEGRGRYAGLPCLLYKKKIGHLCGVDWDRGGLSCKKTGGGAGVGGDWGWGSAIGVLGFGGLGGWGVWLSVRIDQELKKMRVWSDVGYQRREKIFTAITQNREVYGKCYSILGNYRDSFL